MKNTVFTVVALVFLAALTVFLRQPAADDIFCDPDVAGVAYSAQELLEGHGLYSRTVETKPPAAYLLFAALFATCGRTMTAVFVAAIVMHLGVLLALFWLGRAMAGHGAGLAAAFVYAFYQAGSAANGPCPNFETWTLLPTALMYVSLWRFLQHGRRRSLAAAGAWAVTAALFKQTVLIFPLLSLPLLWMRGENHRMVKVPAGTLARDLGAFALGFVLPLVPVMIYFATLGDLGAMLRRLNPLSVAAYAASENILFTWDMLAMFGGSFLWHFKFLLLFAALLALLPWKPLRREETEDVRIFLGRQFIFVYLIGALIAVEAGTKFFPHYFMMLLPPLALAAGVATVRLGFASRLPKVLGVVLLAGLLYGTGYDLRLETRLATQALRDRVQLGHLRWYVGCDNF